MPDKLPDNTQNDITLIELLIPRLTKEEGMRNKPYVDTVGKMTIGIGRNLTDVGISTEEAEHLCMNDIEKAIADLDRELSWWRKLTLNRQSVLADMCFNMGIGKKGESGLLEFQKMLAAVEGGDYVGADREMLDSKWAKQVGQRAADLSQLMLRG